MMASSLRQRALQFLPALLAGAASIAQADYAIPQSVIASGGGTSAGGTLSVTGTIGQSLTGASSGGAYGIGSGFWGGGAGAGGGTSDITIQVAIDGAGSGSVTSTPAGISCPSTCNALFAGVASVSLSALPTDGNSVFAGWSGACSGTAPCVIGTAGTQNVTATFAPNNGPPPAPHIDVDASVGLTRYDALTDGLLILRYLFGLTETALTEGALGPTATRTDPAAIKAYLDGMRTALDIDGNGKTDAGTDGLLILRYLFGLRGDSLVSGAVDPLGSRNNATDIETYIQSLMPQ